MGNLIGKKIKKVVQNGSLSAYYGEPKRSTGKKEVAGEATLRRETEGGRDAMAAGHTVVLAALERSDLKAI